MCQELKVCLCFYSIFSMLVFVFMLVASKMATAVTDLTSLYKTGQKEIKEEAQDAFVFFIRKHKLF